MRLKRVLLITLAGIKAFLLLLNIRLFAAAITSMPTHDAGFYALVISYVDGLAGTIRSLCLLAVVDFVFCLGRKSYDKNMFGIIITMFAFAVFLPFERYILVAFNIPTFFDATIVDPYTGIAYFYLWTALTTLPFIGLAVAYVVTKWKFIKTLLIVN